MNFKTFRLNKLVRDGIVANHEREGGSCVSRRLDDEEFGEELLRKLDEEFAELQAAPADDIKEYGDVKAVIDELENSSTIDAQKYAVIRDDFEARVQKSGFEMIEINHEARRRAREMGGFKTRTYIEAATVPDTSWLYQYYSERPERFPVVKNA